MGQITPSLSALLEPFANCFHPAVFATFRAMAVAWIVCLGRRTISRVWETTGQAASRDHSPAFRLFSQAAWNWDEVARICLVRLLASLVPGTSVHLVVDDTLCHKRGAKVAFGGIFLDAVLSSRKHKIFRFGTNWVTLGLVVQLPFRKDRFFCVNLLWRVYSKKAAGPTHQTKSQLAHEMVRVVASWLPACHRLQVVADSAYVGKHLLRDLPENVHVTGPVHWRAGLSEPLPPGGTGRRKRGAARGCPRQMLEDPSAGAWQEVLLRHPKGEKKLLTKTVGPVCWYSSAGQRPLRVVLVRDPGKGWRDEALLSTDLAQPAEEVILTYVRRWSVEVCYCESKQLLGFHEPQVWKAESVTRAHPMAWFTGALVLLWYARHGQSEEAARRERPWYRDKGGPAFADMLACCRLHLWRSWLHAAPDEAEGHRRLDWLLNYLATAA